MNLVLEAAAPFQRRARPIWPDVLAWLICGLAGLHAVLLHAVPDVPTQEALLVRLLYPLGMVGAAVIMVYAAWLHPPGPRRWAWFCQTVSLLCGLARTMLVIVSWSTRHAMPELLPNTLYLLMYGFALSGVALYLPWRAWWVGTTPRVLIDSALVGAAALVLLRSVLPRVVPSWSPEHSSTLLFPAFNLAALFAVATVSLRYGRRASYGDAAHTLGTLEPASAGVVVRVPYHQLHSCPRPTRATPGAFSPRWFS